MPRYKLLIEYDGTRYSGWQVQQGARTIQGALIAAARDAFGDVGEFTGSGRTDAGVHALAQVAHVDLRENRPLDRLVYGFNDNLPADINVVAVAPVDRRFHARHDAAGRSYTYQISTRRTAFGKPFVWWVKDTLNVGAMRRAALAAPGMHDYRDFTDMLPDEGSMSVLVESLEIAEHGDLILIRVRASHFLRKMVRRIVGTLVEIGRGDLPVDAIAGALEQPGLVPMNNTAPPSGLFLDQVIYRGERYHAALVPALQIGDPLRQ
ncbi:MAG: tRNA pseudouridine(38-40) synthase TruA [Bacteroidetes bacterium]|nr:tRNA pseudouridine(38-40) synthase TruA [Bacteroidota bacterium]